MAEQSADEVSLEDNSTTQPDCEDYDRHDDRMADARGHVQSVQRDNNSTDRSHKQMEDRKRPKYATDVSSSTSNDSESEGEHPRRRNKRKMFKATKNGRKGERNINAASSSGSDSDSEGESKCSERRSVISETISNFTFVDKASKNENVGYIRFNPHKKEKRGILFSSDMESYVEENFNRFIPQHKINELILNTMPIPDYKGFEIRTIDPLIISIMDEFKNKYERTDKAFMSIQARLMDTMGPLGQLWTMCESIRSKIDNDLEETSAHAQIDKLDFRHLLDLTEKTICLIGQTNVAINYQRRLAILEKINNQDVKKARTLLRDKQECLSKHDKHLFGDNFKDELKEYTKTRKEASEMATALGIKRKSKKINTHYESSRYRQSGREDKNYDHGDNSRPFQFRPPSHNQGVKNSGGRTTSRGSSRGGFSNGRKRGGPWYVQLCFKTMLPRKDGLRVGGSRKDQQGVGKLEGSESENFIQESSNIRKVESFHKQLDDNHLRQNDLKKYNGDRDKFFVRTKTSTKTKNDYIKSDGENSDDKGSSRNVVKRSHLYGKTVQKSVFEQLVPNSKKGWGSKAPKQTYNVPTFQNGRSFYDQRSHKERRLHAKNRFKRGLLSSGHLSKAQKISEIRMGRYPIRAFCSSVRISRGSKVIYKNNEANSGSVETIGGSSHHLSRRYSSDGGKPSKTGNSQRLNFISSPEIGVSNKLGKIQFASNTKVGVSRFSDRFCKDDVLSPKGKDRSNKVKMHRNFKVGHCDSKTSSTVDREIGVVNASDFPANLQSRFLQMDQIKGLLKEKSYEQEIILSRKARDELIWWITKIEEFNGKAIITPCPDYVMTSDASNLGWGASFQGESTGGIWGKQEKDFHINAKELLATFLALQTFAKGKHHVAIHFRIDNTAAVSYINRMGGDKIKRPEHYNEENLGLVSGKGDNSNSGAFARARKFHSRLAFKKCSRLERLESRSKGISTNTKPGRSSRCRPVCFQTQFQTKEVWELETRPIELCDRRFPVAMDNNKGLRIPSLRVNWSLSSQSKEGQSNTSLNSSCMASPTLVSNDTGNVDTRPNKNSEFSQPFVVTPGGTAPLDIDRNFESSGMENFGGDFLARGLSKAASELHEKAWRPGTQLSYKSSWGRWVSWCSEQSINPVQATLANIIEFLTKLFKEGLQYRTINTYRSAISKNHSLIEGLQVGKHPLIIRHMRAIFNERTPTTKYEFSWDVDIVLREILSWGKNHDLDIKLLSWKLVMLLALTSAGRSSELGMLNCDYMKQQGSQIFFELPKHTKTCRPGSKTKSLTFDSFPENRDLCVVSCINDYILYTKAWREVKDNIDRSWLLLSYVKPHRPIVSSSVARWLKETIKKSGISKFYTGHSTRSASTSKAKRVGLSTQDVIDQAKWTNESTFMRFYCKPMIQNDYQQAVLTRSQK